MDYSFLLHRRNQKTRYLHCNSTLKMQRIIVVGAGGHGRVIADILDAAGGRGAAAHSDRDSSTTPLLCRAPRSRTCPCSAPAIAGGTLPHDGIVIGIGDNAISAGAGGSASSARGERPFGHPSAVDHRRVDPIGDGDVVCGAGASHHVRRELGRGGIINTNASVDHDSRIGDFAHVSPGVTVGAQCRDRAGNVDRPHASDPSKEVDRRADHHRCRRGRCPRHSRRCDCVREPGASAAAAGGHPR